MSDTEVFNDPGRARSDARLVTWMLSLGVVPEEKVKSVLTKAYDLAEKSADNGNARDYAACMKIPIAAARLETLERHKQLDKQVPDQHRVSHDIERLEGILGDLHRDDAYLELRRRAALEHCSQSGANGNGHGPVGNGSAPGKDRRRGDSSGPA